MIRKTKANATVIRNGSLFCLNCGGEKAIIYPIGMADFAKLTESFNELHKKCTKSWEEPKIEQSLSLMGKINFWLMYSERGISSETMVEVITGKKVCKYRGHPHDPDDFRRCYLLLNNIPELKPMLYKMKEESSVWSNLVDNWDTLTIKMEELLAGGKNDMYEIMKKLGC